MSNQGLEKKSEKRAPQKRALRKKGLSQQQKKKAAQGQIFFCQKKSQGTSEKSVKSWNLQ